MKNPYNAFTDQEFELEPLSDGKLSGLRFAVKDVFSIKGVRNTAGNPDWYRTHEPAAVTAPAINLLLKEGAGLSGLTITDELMYSLHGENIHYGTPVNPEDPERVSGGSSSGSAVAAAAGLTDFALGTDTGGSVRIPSAYCGLYGFRPTHGGVSLEDAIPLAPSFDTVGWMARNPQILKKAGQVLLNNEHPSSGGFSRMIVSKDGLALADSQTQKTLTPYISFLESRMEDISWVDISDEGLSGWADTFRILQGYEIWKTHGKWIQEAKPDFGPGIKERFRMASQITEVDTAPAAAKREQIRHYMNDMLGRDSLLIIPTVPGEAPLAGLDEKEVEEKRKRTLQLACIAGLAGLPQITVPVRNGPGPPVALSAIAGLGQDERLLQWASEFSALHSGERDSKESENQEMNNS